MQNKFGETMKSIRTQKGMTRKDISMGILTVQGLANFENGVSKISIDRLAAILNRCGISWTEYMTESDYMSVDRLWALDNELTNYYFMYKVEEIKKMYEHLYQIYLTDQSVITYGIYLVAKNTFFKSVGQNNKLEEQELKLISDYLFNLTNWQSFEYYLYYNLIDYFPVDFTNDVDQGLLNCINQSNQERNILDFPVYKLLSQVIGYYIEKNLYRRAYHIVRVIEKNMESQVSGVDYLFDRIFLSYRLGLGKLKYEKEEGVRAIKKSIEILDTLGNHDTIIRMIYRESEELIQSLDLDVSL